MFKKRLLWIAIIMLIQQIVSSYISLKVLNAGNPGGTYVGIFLTLILGIFLALGKNWARILAGVLYGFGSIVGLLGIAALFDLVRRPNVMIVSWFFIAIVVYGIIGWLLIFNKAIKGEVGVLRQSYYSRRQH